MSGTGPTTRLEVKILLHTPNKGNNMDEQLSVEAIQSNIEFYKRVKQTYLNLYTEALLNEVKYMKMLQNEDEEE